MADMAGGDYLYTFGFNFETSGLDQLLGAIEGFAQRAQAGFGSSLALPEGVSSAAATEGVVPLGTPGQVESATQGIEAGLKAFVESLRQAGDLSSEQLKRVSEVVDAQIASIRRGAGRYAQRAEPQGVLYGPTGEVLVHPQEQARLRLMEQGRVAATARGRAEASVQGPIEKLLPPTKKVEEFEYIVDPANRAELNAAIQARAKLYVQERLFSSLDNAEKQKEISASEENREAAADEALARRRYAAGLKAEMLELTKEGGEYEPVRGQEVFNRLEAERQQRQDRMAYLTERRQTLYKGPEIGPDQFAAVTPAQEDAALRLAEERDKTAISLSYYRQKTDEDRESIAEEKLAREDDALAIREHATGMREARDQQIRDLRARYIEQLPEGRDVDVKYMDETLGEPYAQRLGRQQAAEAIDKSESQRTKAVILQGSQEYEDNMAIVSASQKMLAAEIKNAAETILAEDTDFVQTVSEGNEAQRERQAQEEAQTQQLLAVNEEYIKARAEGAVAAERVALQIAIEEGQQREALKTDPRGGVDILKLRGVEAAYQRVEAAETKIAEVDALRAAGGERALGVEQVKRRELAAAVERETLSYIQGTSEGIAVRRQELGARLERERQARTVEGLALIGRRTPLPGGGTDIEQEANLQLMRELDTNAVALSRHTQQTESDRRRIAQVENAREDEALAIEDHARTMRQQQDLEIRQRRYRARTEGTGAVEPEETYVERRGAMAHEREMDAAEIAMHAARQRSLDMGYQAAVEETTVVTRKQAAQIKETVESELNADREYIDARGTAAAFTKSTAAKQNALTEELLRADQEFINATAAAALSRRQQQVKIDEATRKQEKASGFDVAGVAARENVAKQLQQAQVQLAQSEIMKKLPAGERIDLVTGGAGAAADRKILDAQINAQVQETLNASRDYKDAVVKGAAEKKLLNAQIEAETIDAIRARATREDPDRDKNAASKLLASSIIKRQALDEEVKLRVLQEQVKVEQESLRLGEQSNAAKRLTLQKQLQVAQREGAQLGFQQAGFGTAGTRFQRAQAQIDISRSGQLRDPREYQTLGAFFGQRAMNTFGYLTSGIAFYGLFDQFKQALTEAANVQREMTILQSTFQQTDKAGDFTRTKDSLLEIANTTGRLGSETINVFRQLYGAFQENIPAALTATQQSLKFAQVTGLDPKEINDSITAIALSFNTLNVTPFLDQAIKLEQVFGVLPEETIQFAADLAPLAEQMGFTADQLLAFGAAAQAVSGKTGGALAEQFGRVFEVFTDPTKITDLEAVFSRELPQAMDSFIQAMATGDVEGAFEVILKNLDELDKSAPGKAKNIRDALVNIAGGPRQAGALAAMLNQPGRAFEALTGQTGDATGALESRFEEVQKSLTQMFEQIKRAVEGFMQAIIQSGLGDALVHIGTELEKIISTATVFLNVITAINDIFHGIPGEIFAVIAVIKVLSTAMNTMQRLGLLEAFLGSGISGRLPGAARRPSARAAAAAEAEAPRTGGGVGDTAKQVAAPVAAGGIAQGVRTAVTSAGGVRALGTGAGLSAFGSSIGASLASAAVPIAGTIALLAVTGFVSHMQEVQAKTKEAQAKFDAEVVSKIKQGLDPNVVMGQLAAGEKDVSPDLTVGLFGFDTPISFTPPQWDWLGPFQGEKSAAAQKLDLIRKTNAERQNQELSVVARNLDQKQRQDLADVIARGSGIQDRGEYNQFRNTLVAQGGLEKLFRDFAANPTDPLKNDAVARTIDWARGNLPPAAKAELEKIANKFKSDAEQAGRQQLEDTGTLDEDIRTATERLKAGIGSTPEVKRAFDEKIKLLQATLNATIDPRLRDSLQLQLATYTKQRNDVIAAYIKDQEDRFDKLQMAAHGYVEPRLKQERLLAHATDPSLDIETHYNSYVEYIQTQQDTLQKNAGLARTAIGKLRILQRGMPIPEEVREGAQAAGIGAQYQEYAATLGINADAFGTWVQAQAKLLQEDQQTVVLAIVDARITQLKALMAAPHIVTQQQITELARLEELRNQLLATPPPETPDPGATATASPEDIWNATIEANKERAQKLQALQDLNSARLRDPIATARGNIEKAHIAAREADPESVEFLQAQIDEQNAINELADANDAIVAALFALAQVQTRDPRLKAQYALDAAIYVREHAHGTKEWLEAQAAVEKAIQAVQDAENEVVQAMYTLAQAQATNPVLRAQYAVDAAQATIANAHDTASEMRAMAAKVQADRALRDAIYDVANSQVELLEAIANAAGDTVGAANIALTLARQKFDQVMASTPDDVAAVNRARGDVIAAERASYDATLNQKQDDIQFALDMKQITKQQAIGMLQSLLAIPTNTLAQQRAIQRQIESLKGELGQDFQFNLPSILGLPTLYEARRLSQGAGMGLGGYQDNRQISIQVFANTNADPNQIAAAVADVMGPPQTFGVSGRRY